MDKNLRQAPRSPTPLRKGVGRALVIGLMIVGALLLGVIIAIGILVAVSTNGFQRGH